MNEWMNEYLAGGAQKLLQSCESEEVHKCSKIFSYYVWKETKIKQI